jgi:hypothetical protein
LNVRLSVNVSGPAPLIEISSFGFTIWPWSVATSIDLIL